MISGDAPKCPACGKPGMKNGWSTEGILSLVRYLCPDPSCPRARVPWYIMHLEQTPGRRTCPLCGKPYLTLLQMGHAPGLYLHKVKRGADLSNGLLEVAEACSVELQASSVGTGG